MTATYDFRNQVALVTGAGSGMGLATARAFASAGARVALLDLGGDALDRAVHELRGHSGDVLALPTDVTDEDQVRSAIGAVVDRFGRVDAAFNNAGIMLPPSDTADSTGEDFDRLLSVNLRGVWAALKHELRQMRTQGSGAVVNCSSVAGLGGSRGRSSYSASKHGIIGLTRSAALEVGPYGVRVNTVSPGTIETPMVTRMFDSGELDRDDTESAAALRRLGRPEEIAAAVLWLCSTEASYVTGATLPVDGGMTA